MIALVDRTRAAQTTIVALSLTCGIAATSCSRGEQPAPRGPAPQAPSAAEPAPGAPKDAPKSPPEGLRIVPDLDKVKGAEAAAAYVAFLNPVCRNLDGREEELRKMGLDGDADSICDTPIYTSPFASGSFLRPRADEVLLSVSTGGSRASGSSTIAVMRRDGGRYHFVRHMLRGCSFNAAANVHTSRGTDLLLVCAGCGSMGIFPRSCDFFGQDSVAEGWTHEGDLGFGLVHRDECGPIETVSLGEVSVSGERLLVPLVVEKSVMVHGVDDDKEDPHACGKATSKSSERFVLEYVLESAEGETGLPRLRRLAPIPKQVQDAL